MSGVECAHGGELEQTRLFLLRRLNILEEAEEQTFEDLARLAARVTGSPLALVSLLGAGREVIKGAAGLPEPWRSRGELPLSHSLCRHVVSLKAPLVVGDARQHAQLKQNAGLPALGIVAYLGSPLVTTEGVILGALAVIDHKPRVWRSDAVESVRTLARAVTTEVERRMATAARAAGSIPKICPISSIVSTGVAGLANQPSQGWALG